MGHDVAPLPPLAGPLAKDLDRAAVRSWCSPPDRRAVERPEGDLAGAMRVVGRLVRSGDVSRAARAAIDGWWKTIAGDPRGCREIVQQLARDAERAIARAREGLDGFAAGAKTPGDAVALLAARDDAESAAVAIGIAAGAGAPGAADAERQILAELAKVDALADAVEDLLADAVTRAASMEDARWLRRASDLDESAWWLAPLVVRSLRASPHARAALDRVHAPLPLRRSPVVRVRRTEIPASLHLPMGSRDAGAADALLEAPLGAPLAELFDGAVLVYAVRGGGALAGLIVRERGGELARIESVELSPPSPIAPEKRSVDLAWWVALAGAGDRDRDLIVRYRMPDRDHASEESLRIEIDEG